MYGKLSSSKLLATGQILYRISQGFWMQTGGGEREEAKMTSVACVCPYPKPPHYKAQTRSCTISNRGDSRKYSHNQLLCEEITVSKPKILFSFFTSSPLKFQLFQRTFLKEEGKKKKKGQKSTWAAIWAYALCKSLAWTRESILLYLWFKTQAAQFTNTSEPTS